MKTFNGISINDDDRSTAKQNFEIFDGILSKCTSLITKRIQPIPTDPAKKQEMNRIKKENAEGSLNFVEKLLDNVVKINDRADEIYDGVDYEISKVIRDVILGDDDERNKCIH